MKLTNDQLKLAANTIRCLAADMVEQAKSGHPGVALGLADVATSLWLKFLDFDPKDVAWPDRDRLVFSGGHGSSLVYSLLHLSGAGDLKLDELKTFRQLGSRCAGHPERGLLPGVEVTTGPLGQGIAMAVGMAIAERMDAARWNVDAEAPVVDHRTWVFCGDGDLEEGISHEACSLAGAFKLDRLCLVYDSNNITIEGTADLALVDDTRTRFEAYGWKVLECDGHDFDAIDRAFRKALKVVGQPTLIIAKTHIGMGCPTKQDTSAVHGAPLGAEELAGLKRNLGFDPEKFFDVPGDVYDWFEDRGAACHRMNLRWKKALRDWTAAHADLAAARDAAQHGYLPQKLEAKLPVFDPSKPLATRNACGAVMCALAAEVPFLVGGSADLEPSNKTNLKPFGWNSATDFSGRNFHWGIRELGMSAIVNGLVAHGGYRAFGATFAVFSDYCKPAMRLAALMGLPSMWVFSHDSFYVGEDGPTHEPVEQLAMLRTTPNLCTFRPADANETAASQGRSVVHLHEPPEPARPGGRRAREGREGRLCDLGGEPDARRAVHRDGQRGLALHRGRQAPRRDGAQRARRLDAVPRAVRAPAARLPREHRAWNLREARDRGGRREVRLGTLCDQFRDDALRHARHLRCIGPLQGPRRTVRLHRRQRLRAGAGDAELD